MIKNNKIIAVDAMGGDFGPSVVVPGALDGARKYGAALMLVGDKTVIDSQISKLCVEGIEYEIVHTSQVADMDEKPSDILRRKKDASIQVACRLVREGNANAVISAGNSGATVACGMFILGRIPGVERPTLASVLPTEIDPMVLLDVGANVDCRPHHLFQFGLMGDALARDQLGRSNPRIGLLSIGEEEGKGNIQVKEAYELLKLANNINFIGNVEGRDIFTGKIDVVVCDGFVGNVALKLSEGITASMGRLLKRTLLSSGLIAKVGTLFARKAFKNFAQVVDYAEYGGAPVLGLKGIALVCHGASNTKAICNAVGMAARFVEKQTVEHLEQIIGLNEELTRFGRSANA
jgi:glycerol-3-phosphate acyltransferase PlsX